MVGQPASRVTDVGRQSASSRSISPSTDGSSRFTIAVAMVTGLIFGLAPAWRASHVDPQAAMKAQGRGVVGGRSHDFASEEHWSSRRSRSRSCSSPAAGLLLGSWRRLATSNPGFRRTQVLLVSTNMHGAQFGEDTARRDHSTDARATSRAARSSRTRRTAEVTPISGSAWNGSVKVDGFTPASKTDAMSWMNEVSDGYFVDAWASPILAGRDFDGKRKRRGRRRSRSSTRRWRESSSERQRRRAHVAAQPGQGSRSADRLSSASSATSKYRSLRETMPPIVYLPRSQSHGAERARKLPALAPTAPLALAPSVKAVVAEIRPAHHDRASRRSSASSPNRCRLMRATRHALRFLRRPRAAARDDRSLRHHVLQRRAPPQRDRRAHRARRGAVRASSAWWSATSDAWSRRRRDRHPAVTLANAPRGDVPLRREAE